MYACILLTFLHMLTQCERCCNTFLLPPVHLTEWNNQVWNHQHPSPPVPKKNCLIFNHFFYPIRLQIFQRTVLLLHFCLTQHLSGCQSLFLSLENTHTNAHTFANSNLQAAVHFWHTLLPNLGMTMSQSRQLSIQVLLIASDTTHCSMSLLPTFLRRRRNCHHNSSPSILPPRLSRPPPVQPLAIRYLSAGCIAPKTFLNL